MRLQPKKQWTTAKTKDELGDAMRSKVEGFPGVKLNFSQVIQTRNDELIWGINAQITVKIFGEDQETLRKLADNIRDAMSHVQGVEDLAVELVAGEEHLEVDVDRDNIARYGLNIADVLEVTKIAIGGDQATDVLEGQRRFAIFVRLRTTAIKWRSLPTFSWPRQSVDGYRWDSSRPSNCPAAIR